MEAKNEIGVCSANVNGEIESRILTVRGMQVMLDRDLAELYGVETKYLNRQVRSHIDRFPDDFMFQLSKEELENLRCKYYTSSWGGNRYLPCVFTEQGVAMLSGVLHSQIAIQVNIQVMRAFIDMRRHQLVDAELFKRVELVERRQIIDQSRNDERFEKVFRALDERKERVQGVFYDGQLWDARSLVEQLIARAKTSILLIDNWVGVGTLDMLAKKGTGVTVTIVTSEHRDRKGNPRPTLSPTDLATFNAQYPALSVVYRENFHDRFLILDDRELYLIGASLKDLGRKCFAFTKLDAAEIPGLKARV